ncbi:MAG: hypothetical protein ACYSO2_06985 [Planctomycetota bacterium]
MKIYNSYNSVGDLAIVGGSSVGNKFNIQPNGNVGIGTSSPSQRTVISGVNTFPALNTTAVSNASLLISNSDVAYGTYFATTGTGTGLIQQRRNTSAVYYDLNLQPYGGNVGIGTTSPLSKLHIDSSEAAMHFTRTGQETYRIIHGTSGLYFTRPNSSALKFGITQNSHFDIYDTAASVMFRADSSSGNVGIGTTSPTAPLHIEGGTNSEVLKIEADSNPFVRWVENGTNVGYLQFLGDNAYLSNMSNGSFFFRTNNTDKMTILSGGNVGIGTTSPGAKLQIGSATFAPNSNLTSNLLQIKSLSGFAYLTIGNGDSANSTSYIGGASGFTVVGSVTDAGVLSEHMRITNTGNVGIGTTSPNSKLQINVGTDQNIGFNSHLSVARISSYDDAFSASTPLKINGSDLRFDISGNEKMRIDSSGNVGIGTSSPASRLEVDGGDIEVDDSASGLILRSPDGTRYRVTVANGGTLSVSAV